MKAKIYFSDGAGSTNFCIDKKMHLTVDSYKYLSVLPCDGSCEPKEVDQEFGRLANRLIERFLATGKACTHDEGDDGEDVLVDLPPRYNQTR